MISRLDGTPHLPAASLALASCTCQCLPYSPIRRRTRLEVRVISDFLERRCVTGTAPPNATSHRSSAGSSLTFGSAIGVSIGSKLALSRHSATLQDTRRGRRNTGWQNKPAPSLIGKHVTGVTAKTAKPPALQNSATKAILAAKSTSAHPQF